MFYFNDLMEPQMGLSRDYILLQAIRNISAGLDIIRLDNINILQVELRLQISNALF